MKRRDTIAAIVKAQISSLFHGDNFRYRCARLSPRNATRSRHGNTSLVC